MRPPQRISRRIPALAVTEGTRNPVSKLRKIKFGTMSFGQNNFSDYGSGSSSNSLTSWPPQDTWSSYQSQHSMDRPVEQKSLSYQDLATGKCTLEDLSRDFQMNGMDSPYTPIEDRIWSNRADGMSGMGPAGAYCRQSSWPAPERSPAPRLPRPRSEWIPSVSAREFNPKEFTSSTPVEDAEDRTASAEASASLSVEQARVLASLPDSVLFSLLHDLEHARGTVQKRPKRVASECRFCKNNGERESYYRAHALKDGAGRVTCPVLRAFVCRRCGARGDRAHTSKYCPLSTADERIKSTAMMRSVFMASGRRRPASLSPPAPAQYVAFGDTTPSVISDTNVYNAYALTMPLDPLWAALEQKLLL